MKRLIVVLLISACAREEKLPPPVAELKVRAIDTAHGRQLVDQYGCASCHTFPGATVKVPVGPSLEGIGSRAVIANKVPNNAENLAKFLQDPQAVDPHNTMPNVAVTPADSHELAAYLLSLK